MVYETTVQSLGLREFLTGDYESKAEYVPDDLYQQLLRNMVIFCVDGILVNRGEMLIAKRRVHPHPDWWHIGGRMRPGESFAQAAIRNLKRELGLEFAPVRFVQLGLYNLIWPTSRSGVDDSGVHDVSLTMLIFVTEEERAMIKLNEEYEGEPRWIRPDDLTVNSLDYHPALVQMASDVAAYLAKGYSASS